MMVVGLIITQSLISLSHYDLGLMVGVRVPLY